MLAAGAFACGHVLTVCEHFFGGELLVRAYVYESSTGCTGPPPSKAPLKNRISAWPLWQVSLTLTALLLWAF